MLGFPLALVVGIVDARRLPIAVFVVVPVVGLARRFVVDKFVVVPLLIREQLHC